MRKLTEAQRFAKLARDQARKETGAGWVLLGPDLRKALVLERVALIAWGWVLRPGGGDDQMALFQEVVRAALNEHEEREEMAR